MSFIADKQSLEDLNLLGKYKSNSIYSLFNQLKTSGGEKLLEALFRSPLSDPDLINERSATFQYFQLQKFTFPFKREVVDKVEQYLNETAEGSILSTALGLLQMKVSHFTVGSEAYEQLRDGLALTIELLLDLADYIEQFKGGGPARYATKLAKVKQLMKQPGLIDIIKGSGSTYGRRELSLLQLIRYQHLLKNTLKDELRLVFEVLYELDLYIAVSDVSRQRNMTYANALPASVTQLKARELRHPGLEKGVTNAISLNREENVLFLTGANMAGKSTWMKTIGTSIYLAHLGMPLAAESFEFSVMEGIYSSINVPDNLNLGYSHFYAEVLRVKEVALRVSEGKNLLVLFDELFKGTNVKDAFDATLAVSEAFAAYTNCLFVISTHIIEVGEALRERCGNIQFRYLATEMDGTSPRYTYQLKEGITSDRQGMMIIENERILEIIEGRQ